MTPSKSKDLAIQFPIPGDYWWEMGHVFSIQSVNPSTGSVVITSGLAGLETGQTPCCRIKVWSRDMFVSNARHYLYQGNLSGGSPLIPINDNDDNLSGGALE